LLYVCSNIFLCTTLYCMLSQFNTIEGEENSEPVSLLLWLRYLCELIGVGCIIANKNDQV